mgnify:CR=1 FL=1
MRFSPDGQNIASSSFDRLIFLWRTYDENENYMVLKVRRGNAVPVACRSPVSAWCSLWLRWRLSWLMQGHKNAVLEVHWFQDGETIVTCSADKTVRAWNCEEGSQVKKLSEHQAVVNSVCPLRRGPQLFASGADDGVIKVRKRRVVTASGAAAARPLLS